MGLKERLAEGDPLYGLWLGLANPYTAEICAGSGADWLVIDGEHSPNTLMTVLGQVQAAGDRVEVIAKLADHDPTKIAQHLDLGIMNLLVPGVESAEQAARIVAATRYPPQGSRGVSTTLTRATDFGRHTEYLRTAHERVCLFVMVESVAGVEAVEQIAGVRGVDGIFIAPPDLAASLGHLGNARHPVVRDAIHTVLDAAQAAGLFAGIFASSAADGREWAMKGAALVAVGSDVGVLQRGTRALVQSARGDITPRCW